MIQNTKALQMMISANRASADTIGEIVSDIQRQGVQATQIIDRHRAMLRGHQLDKQAIDLHVVINDSLAMVAHDLRSRGIEGIVEMSSDPCLINGDQVLLRQVLVNLVVNAADAMAVTPPGKRRVMVRSGCQATTVQISVADTGTGLPAQLEGKLFAPFMTTKSQGLGIGLTIVRTIVDAHGGAIEARNNPDGGATFTVTLPRSEAAAMLSAPEGAA
jgi:signal transduction histidine kinase